jgi:excisionase family DNA binding protein
MNDEKEYITLVEAAAYTGIKRATIYNYLNDLSIQTHKFGRDKRAYISMSDAKRLKEYKEKPWTVKVETRKTSDAA